MRDSIDPSNAKYGHEDRSSEPNIFLSLLLSCMGDIQNGRAPDMPPRRRGNLLTDSGEMRVRCLLNKYRTSE